MFFSVPQHGADFSTLAHFAMDLFQPPLLGKRAQRLYIQGLQNRGVEFQNISGRFARVVPPRILIRSFWETDMAPKLTMPVSH